MNHEEIQRHNDAVTRRNTRILMTGTFLEYFDLMLYVHMAMILNDVFFSKEIMSESWYTSLAFCSTFLLKPFGGYVFGYFGDRYGRKSILIFTTLLMSGCCIILSVLPSYEQIGVLASITVTICRLLQGLSSVGESTSSEIYIAEQTDIPIRYFQTALVSYSGVIGMAAALLVAKLIISFGLSYKVVFFAGAVVGAVGYTIRITIKESDEFLNSVDKLKKFLDIDCNTPKGKKMLQKRGLLEHFNIKDYYKAQIAYFCVFCGWPVCFYFSYVYCGSILKDQFGLSKEAVIDQNFLLSILNLIGLFGWIYLTKFIHPLKVLIIKLFFYIPFILLIPWLLTVAESHWNIFFIQVVGVVLGNSTIPARGVFLMHFPTLKRFTNAGFLNGLSHVFVYLYTSAGLVITTKYFGNYGILWISIPASIAFIYGIWQFRKLEQKTGDYYIFDKIKESISS